MIQRTYPKGFLPYCLGHTSVLKQMAKVLDGICTANIQTLKKDGTIRYEESVQKMIVNTGFVY